MDLSILRTIAPFILEGALVTIRLVALVLVIGTPLAVLVALGRNSRFLWLSIPLGILSAFTRGLPPLLILFCVYFVLPLLGIRLNPFPAAVIGLGFYIVFYFAECVRGGLAAVPPGQQAAIRALGIPPIRGFCRIILPQALPAALPAYLGYATEVVKNSALASAIAVPEMMGNAYQLIMSTGRPFEILLLVAVIYALLDLGLLALQRVCQQTWQSGRVGVPA